MRRMGGSADPPFEVAYKNLLDSVSDTRTLQTSLSFVEVRDLPLIDLKQLGQGEAERQACKELIARASREWGFFQIINHGVCADAMDTMRAEQVKLFRKPFEEKKALKFSAGSYRWGTPSPTCFDQLSWSEAFHVQLSDVFGSQTNNTLRLSMERFALTVSEVAKLLADILAEEMSGETQIFEERWSLSSCYLRLNRYPPCPSYSHMMGLIPHTDTSFLTVLHQDKVGGLQLIKDGDWIAVKPNPDALIVNIGDLFQALSNNMYKSVEHRVVANPATERFSAAYFFCPPADTVIESRGGAYRGFSFGEYKKQIEVDVRCTGQKVGLRRFLNFTN